MQTTRASTISLCIGLFVTVVSAVAVVYFSYGFREVFTTLVSGPLPAITEWSLNARLWAPPVFGIVAVLFLLALRRFPGSRWPLAAAVAANLVITSVVSLGFLMPLHTIFQTPPRATHTLAGDLIAEGTFKGWGKRE